jgi:hypothetical protein
VSSTRDSHRLAAEKVDVLSRRWPAAEVERFRLVGLLSGDDLDPARVPLFALPALDTHGAEREQRDRAVALAEFDAAADLFACGRSRSAPRTGDAGLSARLTAGIAEGTVTALSIQRSRSSGKLSGLGTVVPFVSFSSIGMST